MNTKKLDIQTLIDTAIENTFPYLRHELIENEVTYEELVEYLQDVYLDNLLLIKEEFFDLYKNLLEDSDYYNFYYLTLFESALLNAYKEEYIEEVFTEIISFLSSHSVILKIIAIVFMLFYILGIFGRLSNKVKEAIFRIGNYLRKVGEDSYYFNYFFKNIPRECRDKLNLKGLDIFDKLKALGFDLERGIHISPEKLFTTRSGSPDIEAIKANIEYIDCGLRYFIKICGLQLMLYFRCLADNKKFLDLASALESLENKLLQAPEDFDIDKTLELSEGICHNILEDFKRFYRMTDKIIESVFAHDISKRREYYKLLSEAIKDAINYGKKLLDKEKREKIAKPPKKPPKKPPRNNKKRR